jgi:hypothetical protein
MLGLQETPWPTAQKYRQHTGCRRWHYVIIHPVADIGNIGRRHTRQRGHAREKLRRRLLHAPAG